jgi:hypothetical protein
MRDENADPHRITVLNQEEQQILQQENES